MSNKKLKAKLKNILDCGPLQWSSESECPVELWSGNVFLYAMVGGHSEPMPPFCFAEQMRGRKSLMECSQLQALHDLTIGEQWERLVIATGDACVFDLYLFQSTAFGYAVGLKTKIVES